MTPQEAALAAQVDAIFAVHDGWVDRFLLECNELDAGEPGDQPDHEFLMAMDRYEITPAGEMARTRALLDRLDQPHLGEAWPVVPPYDWARDEAILRAQRMAAVLRACGWALFVGAPLAWWLRAIGAL